MKATKLAAIGLLSIGSLGIGGLIGHADDATAKSKADVTFRANTEIPADPEHPVVIDPEIPDGPGGPVNPGEEGSGGDGTNNFNINWVSNFKFGELTIGNEMKKYALPTTLDWSDGTTPTTGLANFLQVTDNRGKNTGWQVSVSGSELYRLDEQGNVTDDFLKGAAITLNDSGVIGVAGNEELAPTPAGTGVNLVGGMTNVFVADANKGQGTWTLKWGGDDINPARLKVDDNSNPLAGVELNVPVTAVPKVDTTYKADLTWTLTDAPTE